MALFVIAFSLFLLPSTSEAGEVGPPLGGIGTDAFSMDPKDGYFERISIYSNVGDGGGRTFRPPPMRTAVGLSAQHDLSPGNRNRLTGLILLLVSVHDRPGYVFGRAAAMHRYFADIKFTDIFDGFCPGHLACPKILHEQTILRIGPEWTFIVVPGTYCIYLYPVGD